MKSRYSIVKIIVCGIALSILPNTFGGIFSIGHYYTWGIAGDSLIIPDGSVVTEAVLKLQNVSTADVNPYVHLLANPEPGFVAGNGNNSGDYFLGHGVVLQGSYTNGSLIYSLSGVNDATSPIWDLFGRPFNCRLANGADVSFSSALLEFLDYAATGASFGFGLNADRTFSFEKMVLELTVESFEGQYVKKVLSFTEQAGDGEVNTTVETTYEAEAAVLSGCVVNSVQPGYTGTGFADYVNPGNDYIEWTVNVSTSGQYELQFRYALASGNRPLQIKVNGQVVASNLSFPATESWTSWGTVSAAATLSSGVNTVRATAIGSSGGNVDHLKVISR